MTLLTIGAAPAAAKNKAGQKVTAEFGLRGSNGYLISVQAEGDSVTVDVGNFDGQATYTVPARVSTRGIWAHLGKRGRIAVEFRPSGAAVKIVPPRSCVGKSKVTRFGAFVGTIRFNGERRYTEVDAARAEGSVRVRRPWKCKRDEGGGGYAEICRPIQEEPTENVVLQASSPRHKVAFAAFLSRLPGGPGATVFLALSSERRGRMQINRSVFVSAAEEAFVYDGGLASATVSPPRPFSGSATFQRQPDRSKSWRGNLKVSLPGAPNLALAGPAFDAQIARPVSESEGYTCIAAFAALQGDSLTPRQRKKLLELAIGL